MTINKDILNFIYENSSVSIKYRIEKEFYNNSDLKKLKTLQKELINSKRAIHLIECLKNHKEYHGATLLSVENSLNMLIDMGFSYNNGFAEFDNIIESISYEAKNRTINKNHILGYLSHIVIVPFLLRAGLRDEWLIEFTKYRIDTIYNFVKEKIYDIYDDLTEYKNIPKNFQNRPIIKPSLYKNGEIQFPLAYDIYAFSSLIDELNIEYRKKIYSIISYIIDERYFNIEDGYGILSDKKNYWAMGWDSKLTDLSKEYQYNPLLLKLDLMSKFQVVQNSKWLADSIKFLNEFKSSNGLFYYPKNFLTEKNSSWILGNHMSLGENRKLKNSLSIEGTFRTILIYKNLTNTKF